ncbi:caspase-1-like isoform X2 [Emydura macquarii macquarii]|uniref:caspase-1-like isoform X2 n=1 Tax=Emydura macquarii macquarii TaxID=1129001 RepID=UPI00352ABAE9
MADQKLTVMRTVFVESVNRAVLSTLLDDLLQRQVLNEEEVEEVRESCGRTRDQARCLIDGVRRKGARASEIFIERLWVRDSHLATNLGLGAPSGVPETQQVPDTRKSAQVSIVETQPAQSEEWIKSCPLEVFQKIQKEEEKEIYPLRGQKTRTRLALIICNVEFDHLTRRNGAEKDVAGMQRLLEGLGYKVETHWNLHSQAMEDSLKQFAARKEHEASDSTFLVLMSHGVKAGLCGTKAKDESVDILPLDTIYSTFNNKNCKALMRKPKVIIIQACRGENQGRVWVSDSAEQPRDGSSLAPQSLDGLEDDASYQIHVESDFICFCSTTPDTVSWRDPKTGSVFITRLIEQLRTSAWCFPLEEIFRKVQFSFQNFPRQMPTKERTTMMRKFYLFPGH